MTPFLIVSGAGVLALLLGVLPARRAARMLPTATGILALVAALIVSRVQWGGADETALAENYLGDHFTLLLDSIFAVIGIAILLLSWRESSATDKRGEYAGLIMLSLAGMMLVAAAGTTIVLFLGIELFSVSLYVLCAMETWRSRSLEAGLKYLIVGAVGSSILVYGLALLYGATGTTVLANMQHALIDGHMLRDPLSIAALAMIVIGLGFKASAVPLHMWTPDVYDGAPTPITAFMATGTKVAAFAGFIRIFSDSLIGMFDDWRMPVAILAAGTIIVGNIAALLQPGMKRMLAYSGIAQAGYMLIGIAAGSVAGIKAVLYYLVAYTAMTIAAFAVVVMREREVQNGDEMSALRGIGRSRPMMGVVLTVAMLSLAGFPPLSGFIGKFMLFGAAVDAKLTWLAVVGAIGSMISLGYYLKVVAVAWQSGPPAHDTTYRTPRSVTIVAVVSAAAVVVAALFGEALLTLCNEAAQGLIGTINQ